MNKRDIKIDELRKDFIKLKYDVEKVGALIDKYSEIECMNNVIHELRFSILAPAYNFNKFLDALINVVFFENELEDDVYRNTTFLIIELHNCLISIKVAIDRLVKIFRLYKKGITTNVTFGHINPETGKAKGFMGRVMQDKEDDEIMEYVYKEYERWIKECVNPRDVIVHYNDIEVLYLIKDVGLYPHFMYKKGSQLYSFSILEVLLYVSRFYDFADKIFEKVNQKINCT